MTIKAFVTSVEAVFRKEGPVGTAGGLGKAHCTGGPARRLDEEHDMEHARPRSPW
jgi:hypothetical protein